jgi:phosphoadenosine phosphosulfate reductase
MATFSSETIVAWNTALRRQSPAEIVRWALAQAGGRAIVSTNFRPYEAAILHLAVEAQADMPVLWVDHGYNRPATYRHAEALRARLKLNLKPYLPRVTAAHRDAIHGPIPTTDDETGLKKFSAVMKLEPFQRGMKELAPTVWITSGSPSIPCTRPLARSTPCAGSLRAAASASAKRARAIESPNATEGM